MDWQFSDPPNVAVISTRGVISGNDSILRVFRDEDDGGWQFHGMATTSEEDAAVVSLHNIVDLDPSVSELADLPLGWTASRATLKDGWTRIKTV